jgi:hypothetical protein
MPLAECQVNVAVLLRCCIAIGKGAASTGAFRLAGAAKGETVRIRHLLATSVTVLTVIGANFLAVAPSADAKAAPDSQCSNANFDNDSRLGPEFLPDRGPIATIVVGYHRLAGLSPSQFLATYWDPTANGGTGGWRYPPDNGFLILHGQPDEFRFVLVPGRQVDRFGSEFGTFLAPVDTSYAERSLPPQNLDNFDPAYTCSYHDYRVLKPFTVEAGPIAPGFGQPGRGTQYQVISSLLPGDPATPNVMWLISNGYLKRVN